MNFLFTPRTDGKATYNIPQGLLCPQDIEGQTWYARGQASFFEIKKDEERLDELLRVLSGQRIFQNNRHSAFLKGLMFQCAISGDVSPFLQWIASTQEE